MTRHAARAGLTFALGEGWRNACTSRFLGVLMVVLSACVLAGITLADALTVSGLVANEKAWTAAGGHVLVVSNETGISGYDCERLNQAEGVTASVGIAISHERAALSNAPDSNLAVRGATAGLSGLLASQVPLDAVVIDHTTATDFGLTDGQRLALTLTMVDEGATEPGAPIVVKSGERRATDGTRPIAVTDLTILGEQHSSGIIWPIAASGSVDECLVWAAPGAKETLMSALPGLLPGSGDKPTVVDNRLIVGQFTRDYHAEYLTRSWRWVPLAGGAALGLIWVLIRWVRRSEDGLYQSLGAPRPQRALLRLIEWTLYCLAGAALGYLVDSVTLALLHPGAGMQPHLLRSIALGLAGAVTVGAVAGLLPARNPLDALKDR